MAQATDQNSTRRRDFLSLTAAVAATVVAARPSTALAGNNGISAASTPASYPDGLAGASGGAAQFPALLNSYGGQNARVKGLIAGKQYQPPWNVAGVDYRVGIQQGKVLKPITEINLPNVRIENGAVRCEGSNYVIDGYDFTGYTLYLTCQNVTIRNCRNTDCTAYTIYMVGTATGQWHPANITIEYCELTSKQTSLNNIWSFIRLFGGGTNIVQYCDLHHSAGHIYEVAAESGGKSILRYNLIREIGCADPTSHVNYTQTWGSAANAKHDFLFNTFVHHRQPAGGQMLQIDGTNGTILNNVIMAINAPDPNTPPPFTQGNSVMTYMIDVGHAGRPFTNIHVKDNFIDPSLSYAAGYKVFYQPSGSSRQTIVSGNVDMRNGNILRNTD